METKLPITEKNEINKAKGAFKADCMIKMNNSNAIYSISIKSKNGANPAILNHPPRTAKVFQEGGILYDCMSSLDKIIKEYISKRSRKIIRQDVQISKLESAKDLVIKNNFMKVLSYFAFDGSGKGDSVCKSNAIIHYEGENITFIKCISIEEKREYIKTIYDSMIISLRNKGMPKEVSYYCKPWVFEDIKKDGLIKSKGSLHIRIN